MDHASPHPDAESAPGLARSGVGSAASTPTEDPPLSPQQELEQLDESLTEMTDLLLGDEGADDPAGEFAVLNSQPEPQDRPMDVAVEVEDAQEAVAAAMGEMTEALGPTEESGAELPETLPDIGDSVPLPGEPASGDPVADDEASAAMRAVAKDLEQLAAADPAGETTEPAPPPAAGIPTAPSPVEATGTSPSAPAPGEQERTATSSVQAERSQRVVLRRAADAALSSLCTLIAAALEPLGARVQGSSRTLRHSIAWLALWTAFNAACVWGYILMFRSATPRTVETSPTHIAGPATEQGPHAP